MTDSIFPKRPGFYSYAEDANDKFTKANNIIKEANKILAPVLPSKEALEVVSKLRNETSKLISLLESGLKKENLNKIDEAARNVGRIALNIQQLTIKCRVEK